MLLLSNKVIHLLTDYVTLKRGTLKINIAMVNSLLKRK